MSLLDTYAPEEQGPRITAGDHRVKLLFDLDKFYPVITCRDPWSLLFWDIRI